MPKLSKMVERTELDELQTRYHRHQVALNAIMNGTASKPYTVRENIHPDGMQGNSYTFQFIGRNNGYDIAVVTFHCESTGQLDSTQVLDDTTEREAQPSPYAIWPTIYREAWQRWRQDVNKANGGAAHA